MLEILNLFWGFILTKWYVKSIKLLYFNALFNRFILTKWYVKAELIVLLKEEKLRFYIN
ncbi:conserved hypothetical protein [Clostridioides difficile]|uniref:Uncharacterized protein n=1 Tax=Clostridioides difficile TaxID=1496 RepID=A0A069AC36_CLODI|nr:conserved hypothetical protein [Clostridioides difficile]